MTRKRLTIGFVAVQALAVIIAWLWLKLGTGGFSTRTEPSAFERFATTTARKLAVPRTGVGSRSEGQPETCRHSELASSICLFRCAVSFEVAAKLPYRGGMAAGMPRPDSPSPSRPPIHP